MIGMEISVCRYVCMYERGLWSNIGPKVLIALKHTDMLLLTSAWLPYVITRKERIQNKVANMNRGLILDTQKFMPHRISSLIQHSRHIFHGSACCSPSRRWIFSRTGRHDMRTIRSMLPDASDLSPIQPTSQYPEYANFVELDLPGEIPLRATYDVLFLRDSCSCSRCVDPSTQQKLFETSELPLEISVKETKWLPNGSLEIEWDHDIYSFPSHKSIFTVEFLRNNVTLGSRIKANHNRWSYTAWDRRTLEEHRTQITFNYSEYMETRSTLYSVIEQLQKLGICFITSAPLNPFSVRNIAERIGPIRNTFYGETWDVKSAPSAKNVAYTSYDLDFHMDLLYMENPPGLQFLHCMKQNPTGGESRFSDAVSAFNKVQEHDHELVAHLEKFPITYRYKNNGRWYQKSRTFLEGSPTFPAQSMNNSPLRFYLRDFDAINWSPPFQGPLEQNIGKPLGNDLHNSKKLRDFIKAARLFKQYAASENAVYRTKMAEGTCVIFNNRRILHARDPFNLEEGERWLRGCYVDGDCLSSQWRMQVESLGNVPHVATIQHGEVAKD